MELKNCAPVLFVKDAKKARDFYADVLGMTVVTDFGGLNYIFKEGFAIWQQMDGSIISTMLGKENIYNSKATSRFELCFETEDIDEVHQALKEYGVTFLHEINVEPWGQRNIRFYDADGHLLEVGESLHIFLKRIYEEEGKDVAKTAARTYMDPELIRQILAV